MALDYRFDIKLAVENALYEHTTDNMTLKEIEEINPKGIIISPGPGRPENAGILIDMVKRFKGVYPMLGVCLGHQGIAESFGGNVIRAKEIVHGKRSLVTLKKSKLFKGINEKEEVSRNHKVYNIMEAGRYW